MGKIIRKPNTEPYGTRQKRRKALYSIVAQLEEIMQAEQTYWRNIPINLQNGEAYEAAEHAVSTLEDSISSLYEVYEY